MGRWVIAACAAVLAAACADAVSVSPADAGPRCAYAAGKTTRLAIAVPGQGTRTARVHIPRAGRAPRPLLVALHGTGGSGAFMERYSRLSALADRAGFAAVYPDSAGRSWRISGPDSDVRFLDALIDRLLASGCFDARRVSMIGVSNGGGMAARFACAGDDRLAGLVTVAGGYSTLPPCRARRALSVLEIHGTADSIVPYSGPRAAVLPWVRGWIARDGCARKARRTWRSAHVVRLQWGRCRGGATVAHLRLIGGHHAWPGARPADPGPSFGVSAALQAWRFLRGRRLAA